MRRVLLFAALLAAAFAASVQASSTAGTVLITGANRGIGLEFVRQYAERGWMVIATVRKPAEATELAALAQQHKGVRIETLDVASVESIAALGKRLAGQPIDVLVNNAGVLGDLPPQTIGSLDRETFEYVMAVNTFGALKLSETLKPNLLASGQKKVFAMTSGLGSSELTARRGGFYAYRMSKAALNIGFRALAADWRAEGIMVGIIAPGMVETQLLRQSNFPGKGISTAESVTGMIKVIDAMTLENNGKAINYDGSVIPW
jgi:NAD(P)-dependent dehydrogenase (short-subunit alcohol dehydrogenase family)